MGRCLEQSCLFVISSETLSSVDMRARKFDSCWHSAPDVDMLATVAVVRALLCVCVLAGILILPLSVFVCARL